MWYKIDYDRLILLLLPTFLRKAVLFGFVKALASPISTLHQEWEELRNENIKRLSYNSQKCYLRKALNDKFDNISRGITLTATEQLDQDYLFTRGEFLDVYLGTMYLEVDFNYVVGTVDFLVKVPEIILSERENEITAMVDFYALAGKSYKLIKK
jgi:hypothetical protein